MATWTKFQDYAQQKNKAVHNWATHAFKVALTNTAPVVTQTTWNTTDHPAPAAANGYTAGGEATTITESEVGGIETVQGTQVAWTATAGGIGPFRYAVLYNSSAADAAVAFSDYGSSITLNDGEPLTIKFNNASPGTIFTDS